MEWKNLRAPIDRLKLLPEMGRESQWAVVRRWSLLRWVVIGLIC